MMARTLLPARLGPIHFIGIGGIGMSGIAEILAGLGHKVQGSDAKGSALTERLSGLGVTVHVGHRAENLGEAGVVVASTAIREDNPELAEARRRGLPVVHRSEMLAELMRLQRTVSVAGTHGKTTTTTLVATLLDAGGIDPTVINGGVIGAYGSNARLGAGDWTVVEADESDGSFNRLPTTVAIVTNIDPEHLDHWRDFDELRAGFRRFVQGVPFYGLAVLGVDHPEVRALAGQVTGRRVVTFGLGDGADLRATNLRGEAGGMRFDIFHREGPSIPDCFLPLPGDHNVSNALAAVAVALHLGIAPAAIRQGLAGFQGVGRRFTHLGSPGGVRIIDDYAHHPVEIAAALRGARQVATGGRVIAVHQPHRYSRLSALFDDFRRCFADADIVAIAEVYAAGEDPIPGASRDDLVRGIRATGQASVHALDDEAAFEAFVRAEVRPGDIVMCLGAGSISGWAQGLVSRLGG
ncbi:UDP-N-acetylmuramate--L-alanine ligase [Pararhodobacter sp. SW119]|uniref:UDP-N-acetylmuramate--L-alanine ligase n=1 Tax=Pararhodobacter sp. SW119 TaxID=2780075 RepID=UPI001ADFE804